MLSARHSGNNINLVEKKSSRITTQGLRGPAHPAKRRRL